MTTTQQEKIANFKIDWKAQRDGTIEYLKYILTQNFPDTGEKLVQEFSTTWETLYEPHQEEDRTDLARLYRLIMTFKPAMEKILDQGPLFDNICDLFLNKFNLTLDRIRRQINDKTFHNKPKGPVLPGKNKTLSLKYICTECKQTFPIPSEMQAKLLTSEEKHQLPHHCGKEMTIQIQRNSPVTSNTTDSDDEINIYPAEILMQHANSNEAAAEYMKILSVGIDIGSSTSHLVFSRLTLKRERSFFNMSNRYITVNREVIYKGNIIFTPLLNPTTIDIPAIVQFCKEEYQNANITPEMVDTGAVIVTGETAKKKNAAEIVKRIASESGNFVSAAAGPHLESVLGAMGSGAVQLSKQQEKTILNIDIGGGTSNLALVAHGQIISTTCINIGGRLLGIDSDFKIWRIDEPAKITMEVLDMQYHIGDTILEEDVILLARAFADSLMEVIRGPATSTLTKTLMMTENLDYALPIDYVTFSGGVAEIIYKSTKTHFRDIGHYLAQELKHLITTHQIKVKEPTNKIRATVIGAGAFSLSVSGSTCYYDPTIKLPLENVPVVPIAITLEDLRKDFSKMENMVTQSLRNFDLEEGKDRFALYFRDPLLRGDIELFARAIATSLPHSILKSNLVLIILGSDGGKVLGLTLKKKTSVSRNLFCLDELDLHMGDWIDIGKPLKDKNVFPITIKSLVFN